MKNIISTTLFFCLLSNIVIGISTKPQAIIVPTGRIGEITEVQKKMLHKTLESKLDDYFAIVPKELFEEAQEEAFQELEYEDCTEEKCIVLIKDILQVPNAFQMVLMKEAGDTQISITWNDLDQKRVEEDFCEGCKTKRLRQMIEGLVEKLIGITSVDKTLSHLIEHGVLFRDLSRSKWIQNGKQWFKFGDEKKHLRYEGEVLNGVPHGSGTITFARSTDSNFNHLGGYKLVGNWTNGEENGEVSVVFPDGRTYEGGIKNGKWNGHGKETFPDQSYYIGQFNNGLPNGRGTILFKNKTKYEGAMKNGRINGVGSMTWLNGDKYEGEWIDGKATGKGTYYYPNGNKSTGEWKDLQPWNIIDYDSHGNVISRVVNGERQ